MSLSESTSVSMEIDLSCLLAEGESFTPLFENDQEYQDFRERYMNEMEPILKKQNEARRLSEVDARTLFLV